VVSATMTMPTSTVVPSTTTEPILSLPHAMEGSFSPNRTNVNGVALVLLLFHYPFPNM
jgi:hypothetical protein